MNIFLSWSGNLSKQITEKFHIWLPTVIQSLKPYYSEVDIEKGTKGLNDLSEKLEKTNFGLLLMTKENVKAPWILFEAGAISKFASISRVCTVLFDIKDTDLQGPLTQFQHTLFNKIDMIKLLKTINKNLGNLCISDDLLLNSFDKMWPDLEIEIKKILRDYQYKNNDEIRNEKDLLEEILSIVRKSQFKPIELGGLYNLKDGCENMVYFDNENEVINFKENGDIVYQIDINNINTTAKILDSVFQFRYKTWCNERYIQSYLNVLENLAHSFFDDTAQGVFCPFGNMMKIDWKQKRYEQITNFDI